MARERTGTPEWHKGRWHARITMKDAEGKTVRPRVDLGRPDLPNTDEGKAKARRLVAKAVKLAKKGGDVFAGKNQARDDASITIADLADRWLDLIDADPDIKPSTKHAHRTIFSGVIVPALGTHTPRVGTDVLRAFLREKRASRGDQTVRNYANTLTRFFADVKAEKWVALSANPMRDDEVRAVIPSMSTPERDEITFFSRQQAERLLAGELPHHRFGVYVLAMTTGIRDGEVHGLQFRDLHLDAAVPHAAIFRQALIARGKGSAVEAGPLKSKWAKRKAPLTVQAVTWLRWWHAEGWAALVGRKPEADDYVFPDENGAIWRPRSPDILRDDLAAASLPTMFVTPEGDEIPFVFHTCRHTFSTWLGALDVPGEVIDRLLGQAPTSTRAKHYQAPSLEADARHVAGLRVALPMRPGVASSAPPKGPSTPPQSSGQSSRKRDTPRHRNRTTAKNSSLAPVAQWIEQRFPKFSVARSRPSTKSAEDAENNPSCACRSARRRVGDRTRRDGKRRQRAVVGAIVGQWEGTVAPPRSSRRSRSGPTTTAGIKCSRS